LFLFQLSRPDLGPNRAGNFD